MKKLPALLFLFALLVCFFACKKQAGNSPEAPFISLVSMSKDSIRSGQGGDTVALQIYIKDKNGDLVSDAKAFYLKGSIDTATIAYEFPIIDENILDNPNGIEGNIYFFITGDLTTVRLDSLHQAVGDTVQFEIFVMDKAGNESNRITTPDIYIKN